MPARANFAETLGMMISDAALAMLNHLKTLSLLVSEALLQTRVADSDVLVAHKNGTDISADDMAFRHSR
jgi:hypothetical protein